MNKIKLICVLFFLVFGVAALFIDNSLVPTVRSSSSSPPIGFTGAPDEQNCSLCHDETPGPGVFTINAPANYVPGQTYQIQVQHSTTEASRLRWGFEMTALDGTNVGAGTFTNTDGFTATDVDFGTNRYYVFHTSTGTFPGTSNGASWTFNWNAPATNLGPVTFYAAGNQANNNDNPSVDWIYLTNTASLGPTPTVTIINPSSGPTVGGNVVTITGTNFIAPATVTIGGNPGLSVNILDSMTIDFTVPPGTAGPANVVVTTPNGTSNGLFYTYIDPPSLGNYPNTTVDLSDNVTITPDDPPANTTSISVETSTGFVGELTADPVTGVVRVTNAHHANIAPGNYTVTVKAFGPGGMATRNFMLTVTNGTACATNPGFTSPTVPEVMVGSVPYSVAIGDFNGDGIQDFAAVNRFANNVSIRLGDGSGGFTSPAVPEVSVGGHPVSVAIGDFNGDGIQDFATANNSSANISIRLGDGSGGFTSPSIPEVSVGAEPGSIAIGDFNNDGMQDFAATNPNSSSVSIRLGDGSGGFTLPAMPEVAISGVGYIAIGDFNNDGMEDFATSNSNSINVSIRLGDGSGGFTSPAVPEIMVGSQPNSIAIGDFNGDGIQDFAVTIGSTNNVSIRLGDGSGGFTSPAVPEVSVGSVPKSVAIGDFNRDGNQDFAVSNLNSNYVSIRLGNGSGGFTSPVMPEVAVGSSPPSVAIGDFNGDGIQDFVTANSGSNNVSIRLGACSFNISGTVTYGNSITASPPAPRFVKNVSVASTVGTPMVGPVITGTPGTYALTGFGASSYTITPTKTGGANVAISSADAARVAQGVSGSVPFVSDNQRFAADTSGNGTISSTDASKIAQFVTGLPFSPPNLTGQWRFFISNLPAFPAGAHPQERTYASVTSSVTGEDYIGLLIGETTGNYNPASHARPVGSRQLAVGSEQRVEGSGPVRGIEVQLPQVAASSDKEIVIPVSVQGAADKEIFSYEFDLRYDPSVIQPLENPIDVAGTVSRGLSVVANPYEPGLLRVVVYGAFPIDENGLLMNLRFTAVGTFGSVSPLTFERIMFNEGEPGVMVTDGLVEISVAAASE